MLSAYLGLHLLPHQTTLCFASILIGQARSKLLPDASPRSARDRQVIPCARHRGRIPWGQGSTLTSPSSTV